MGLVIQPGEVDDVSLYAASLPSVQLSERAVCDLELLATGAFSPLDRFMGQEDYQRVLDEMRLAGGYLFPLPVTLPVEAPSAIGLDRDVALRDARNEILAVMTIEEIYSWSLTEAARKALETEDVRHPLISEMHRWGKLNISGKLRVVRLPRYYDFQELRLDPDQTRARLEALGSQNVVAFQTCDPLHRAHEEITKRAADDLKATLLLHPVVGLTKPGDVDHYTRVRTYKEIVVRYYDGRRTLLSLFPLAMRFAGPREALFHALIQRNYGANYLIVGRDHASPGMDSTGKPFYRPYDAQKLLQRFSAELGVGMVPFQELQYLPEEGRYEEVARVPSGTPTISLSGVDVQEQYLDRDRMPPAWFTRPEVAAILAESYPPRHRQGVCLWFTGLMAAGKSTTAEILTVLLLERGRQVTLLDGDVVRTHLSKGLGFSKDDRDTNIRRIGFVAAEIVRHGGTVVCAAVSPYRATRNEVRKMIGDGRFVEIFINTPLAVCEQRDKKGTYARARRGEIKEVTGIDDPYEAPEHAEIVLDTVGHIAADNARFIVDYLMQRGLIRSESKALEDVGRGEQKGHQGRRLSDAC